MSSKKTKKKYSKKSQLYTNQVRMLLYWLSGFVNYLFNYAPLFNESEADKQVRFEIEARIIEIRKMLISHCAPKIGNQVVSEMKF